MKPWLLGLVLMPIAQGQTLTITQTRSTNSPEIRLQVTGTRAPALLQQNGITQSIRLSSAETKSLWQAVQNAGPLAALPPVRCAKSISFGTSLYVEIGGQRSPDLSCQTQTDPRAVGLASEARKLLLSARTRTPAIKNNQWKQD